MNNFRKIDFPWLAESLTTLQTEMASKETLWLDVTQRQQVIATQRHTQTIYLRGAVRSHANQPTDDIQESGLGIHAVHFPYAMAFLERLAAELKGELARANYVRLMPWAMVYPHIDTGSYYAIRDRYHFVLDSPGGSLLSSGDEEALMQTGELWWFNNKLRHDSKNKGDRWRTHLIFDLLPHTTHA